MNRRKFFGMTAAALVGAGLPLSLLPERSVFLPPREDWYPSDFVMREVIQFDLSRNKFMIRHDVMFDDHGKPLQNFIARYIEDSAVINNPDGMTVGDTPFTFNDKALQCLRRNSRNEFALSAFANAYETPKILLRLPYGVSHAEYV